MPALEVDEDLRIMLDRHANLAVVLLTEMGHGPLLWADENRNNAVREIQCLACGASAMQIVLTVDESGDMVSLVLPRLCCPRTNQVPGWPSAPVANPVPNDAPDGESDG